MLGYLEGPVESCAKYRQSSVECTGVFVPTAALCLCVSLCVYLYSYTLLYPIISRNPTLLQLTVSRHFSRSQTRIFILNLTLVHNSATIGLFLTLLRNNGPWIMQSQSSIKMEPFGPVLMVLPCSICGKSFGALLLRHQKRGEQKLTKTRPLFLSLKFVKGARSNKTNKMSSVESQPQQPQPHILVKVRKCRGKNPHLFPPIHHDSSNTDRSIDPRWQPKGYHCTSRLFSSPDEITLVSVHSLGNPGARFVISRQPLFFFLPLVLTHRLASRWYWIDGDKDRIQIRNEDDLRAAVYYARTFGQNKLVLMNIDSIALKEAIGKASVWCKAVGWKLLLPLLFVFLFMCHMPMFVLFTLLVVAGAAGFRCARFGKRCVRQVVDQVVQQQPAAPAPSAPPQQQQQQQQHPLAEGLRTLASLGFTDTIRNLKLLQENKGDLSATVAALLE